MSSKNYFLLNKETDFFTQAEYLCSGWMDSGGRQTAWSRLHIQYEGRGEYAVHTRIFTAEQEAVMWKGKKWDIRQMAMCEELAMEEKLEAFSLVCSGEYELDGQVAAGEEALDCLLGQLTGRYLFLAIKSVGVNLDVADFPEIQIFFQTESWLSFLPEVYANSSEQNSFLFRYLSIFQWIYSDMSQKISDSPHMLYPAFASREMLEWLASWSDMDNRAVWNREQMIYLLENGSRLYAIRGTKKYLEEMVRLYTGYVPYIVEYYQIDQYRTDRKKALLLERLYGENAYVITVVLPQDVAGSRQQAAVLRKIIRSSVPADVECRLVILEAYIYLDRYTYVGINSRLGGYTDAALDGNRLMPYTSMSGNGLERRADS